MNHQDEIWMPIKGLEDKYEVSSLGRIKSIRRSVTQRHRSGVMMTRCYGGGLIKPCGHPYLHVHLGGHRRSVRVHVLVAEHFLGSRPGPNWDVDHINGNKKDNRLCNLQWLTKKENVFLKPNRQRDKLGRLLPMINHD